MYGGSHVTVMRDCVDSYRAMGGTYNKGKVQITMGAFTSPTDVTRILEIDAASFADALVGLRRESAGLSQCWKLGNLGSFELDARVSPPVGRSASHIQLTGRLWAPDFPALTSVNIFALCNDEGSVLMLTPAVALSGWFLENEAAYVSLATAALDELGEELLFHASAQRRVRELS